MIKSRTTRAAIIGALSPVLAATLLVGGTHAAFANDDETDTGTEVSTTGEDVTSDDTDESGVEDAAVVEDAAPAADESAPDAAPVITPFGLSTGLTFTVNGLGLGADANPGDGICQTAAGFCTLHAALQEANLVTDTGAGDEGVTIDFSVAGTITVASAADTLDYRMIDVVPSTFSSVISSQGAHFLIDSAVPVTVDFTGLGADGGVEHGFDSGAALFYVASDNVTLYNAGNIRAGEAGIVISGSNVTIDQVQFKDPTSSIHETSIALLDGASNIAISNVTSYSPWFASILVDGGATVSNVTVTNLLSRGVENVGHIVFENDSVVNNFSVVTSNLGALDETSPSAGFYFNPGVTSTGLSFSQSEFLSPNRAFFTFEGGSQTITNTVVQQSRFEGNAEIVNNNTATIDDIVIADNEIVRNLAYTIELQNSTVSNALITNNTITDIRGGGGHTSVWLSSGGEGDNNVISWNTFLQTTDADTTNLWAIWNPGTSVAAGEDTGWQIIGNSIDGYEGAGQGPIANLGLGSTYVALNTFGPSTSGTRDVVSETNVHYFVNNNNAANNLIQTWRPTAAGFTGTEVIVTVAPVSPEGANNDPTGAVLVDVYWTADDNAEVYLGRFATALTASTTASFPTTATSGFIRVQTIDAAGNSSQYSSVVELEEAVAPVAPVISAVTLKNVAGTGEPGATVTVFGPDGTVIGTTTVAEDGTWTFSPTVPFACGTKYTATQTNGFGQTSPAGSFTTPACAAATPGGGQTALPNTGVALDSLGLGAIALLMLGAVLFLIARKRRGEATQ